MRLGVLLNTRSSVSALARQAELVETLGFDLVWLEGAAAPMVAAASLAAGTSAIQVGATARVGDTHPAYLAEEAAVADLTLGGRLVLAVTPTRGREPWLAEVLDILLAAQAARPFRHPGPQWPMPGHASEHDEFRVRVTPAPAQLELPLWVCGVAHSDPARQRGLSVLGAEEDTAAELTYAWGVTATDLGPAEARLRRPALRAVEVDRDGTLHVEDLVSALVSEREAWGMDVAVLRLPPIEGRAQRRALQTLASAVRPRLQLDRLPVGLERLWGRDRPPA